MQGFCCSGIRGSGKISLWYAMRVNRDKEKLLVTCVQQHRKRGSGADRNDRVDHWHFDCGSACLVDLPQNKEENAAAGEYAGDTGAPPRAHLERQGEKNGLFQKNVICGFDR